ncbi:hypothetical protein FS594_27240 (plasmid) [Rahnella aquatilis]|uniref:Uncharacterized protein n=1 Tax=Rahnella perminowiae TaxID=2816244 RepID=A0ABS6KYQ0_9GAMM|nr:hypothetical protein [Rahnella perminowiae]MBU9834728.1 hypothetical protein [Rahnella perminowiae]UJD92433.1 hypothetical protein FS594_27240 [Rahnella aquatilis]
MLARVVVENNNLASVLTAAETNKPGTAEKWQEQQAAIKEACSGGTPVSCEMAMVGVGTVLSAGILPEAIVLINAGNGAIVSSINGKNSFLYGTIGGLGGAVGYGIDNKVITPMLDDVINPTWKTLHWDDIGMGISQPSKLSPVPEIAGTAGGGTAGEVFNVVTDPSSPVNNNNGAAK